MAALTDDDEDWDAAIARAKMRLALPAPSRSLPPELQVTPPPVPVRRVATLKMVKPEAPARASLGVVDWAGVKRPGALWPASARRLVEQELVTPPPVPKYGWGGRPLSGRTKRP